MVHGSSTSPIRRFPADTILHLLRAAAQANPTGEALLALERPALSYGELLRTVEANGRFLRSLGIGRNDHVALVLPNGPAMATAFLTVSTVATSAPLNPAYREAEFDFYLADLQAKALVVMAGDATAARTVAAARGIPVLELVARPEAGAGSFEFQPPSSPIETISREPYGATPGHTGLNGCSDTESTVGRGCCSAETASSDYPAAEHRRPTTVQDHNARPVLETESPQDNVANAGEVISEPTPNDVALVLHTSGTTPRPKLVPLTHRNLCESAVNIATSLALSPMDRCLNVMPLFHIHGLAAALLASLAAGAGVVCAPGFVVTEFFAWLDRFAPTWYTAAPTLHQAILGRTGNHAESLARSRLRLIRSCSAALAPQVMAELERVFRAPVIEAYGMTEAAHQMASNPLPPEARKPGSVGRAAGPEIAILDERSRSLERGQTGEVAIRGANVTPGYVGQPEANASAFTAGWFRTGDLGYLDGDGYLFLTGRLKEVINRGGEKFSPREIDEALLDHPAVAQAVAFARPDAKLGEAVAAAVVVREGHTASAQELREFCRQRLSDFKVPQHLVFLAEIPKGPTGKVQRLQLAEQLGLTAEVPPPASSPAGGGEPRTPLERTLVTLCQEVLRVKRVGIHDSFFQLGGDSILAAQWLTRINAVLHTDLSPLALFESPTIAQLASSLEPGEAGWGRRPAIRRREGGGPAALSFAQERLWFLHQFEGSTPTYHRPCGLRWRGKLNVPALERALNEIVRRHDVLRTVYPLIEGRPVQVVLPFRPLTLPVIDVEQAPLQVSPRIHAAIAGEPNAEATDADARERRGSNDKAGVRLDAMAGVEAAQPFDLVKGPVFRARLLRCGSEEHLLVLTAHHIAFDGWSSAVLQRELAAHYAAFDTGTADTAPALPVQYADFAEWQRRWLTAEALSPMLSYWKHQLSGELPVLALPTDHPRPARQTFHGTSKRLRLEPSLTEALKTFSREEGVTLFTTLFAIFNVLLHRYTGQDDLLVGTPVAGRFPGTERLIGCFVNLLVLRTHVADRPTFRQLLRRAHATVLGALSHQELPFEQLLQALQPARDPSRSPIVQVLFQLRNVPVAEVDLPGLTLEEIPVDTGTAKAELVFDLEETAEGLACACEYNTDLFEPETIQRLLGHWRNLLADAVLHPDISLSRLALLSEMERRTLVVDWNRSWLELPKDGSLAALFEAQVERTPDAVAVIWERESLVYRELNERANRLAHHLRALGVGPEVCVGLRLRRSANLVVGMLGILKAGGAYVPLDLKLPRERLEFLLRDARVTVVVTETELERAPETSALATAAQPPASFAPPLGDDALRTVRLDALPAGLPTDNPESVVQSHHLAYVLYTSGSTGQPKGVAIEHRNALALLYWARSVFTPEELAGVLASSRLAFNVSVFELFAPLCWGGTVIGAEDLLRLSELPAADRVTLITAVPSAMAAWLRVGGLPPAARTICLAGEALSFGLVDQLYQFRQVRRVYDLYGPTEDTVFSTMGLRTAGGPETIGRALPNKQTYVLDAALEPVPIGVVGELYLGGAGVARGYWNRPALTAERFISDPFNRDSDARLYRTGDRARYRPDGTLEFLGRLDDQVKIRGCRVELGEIEAVLRQHPRLLDGAVATWRDASGQPNLAAYFVPGRATASSSNPPPADWAGNVRAWMQTKLPEYMVPSMFLGLERLPRTVSGKLDRTALPTPAARFVVPSEPGRAPSSPMEVAVAEIWQEVLGVPCVGKHDDFFHLGGHSLSALRVMVRLRERWGIEVTARELFTWTTLAELAAQLETRRAGPAAEQSSSP